MKTGRPPIPTRLKVLRGTLRLDRHNPREPALTAGKPAVPPDLPDDALPYWAWLTTLLESLGVLTPADAPAVAYTATRMRDYRLLEEDVRTHGRTMLVELGNGSRRIAARPEVAQEAAAWRDVMSALSQLGLSPTTRSRLVVISKEGARAAKAREFFGD
jgi:P27 family predicted phage terminase small subunit